MTSMTEAPTLPIDLPDVAASEHVGPSLELGEAVRAIEALLFASDEPVTKSVLKTHVGQENLDAALQSLKERFSGSGIVLLELADGFAFRTAEDLDWLFEEKAQEPKKLSRAATETLAVIAYHQPVTRSEIEEIRGVSASKGTLDVLLETGWIQMRGRRQTPGRPVTYGTTRAFLDHFTLKSISDLPGLEELKGAGLLDAVAPLPAGAGITSDGTNGEGIAEDPLDEGDVEEERAAIALWPQEEVGAPEVDALETDAVDHTR